MTILNQRGTSIWMLGAGLVLIGIGQLKADDVVPPQDRQQYIE